MKRSYVICHMMTSIDGKIDGEVMDFPSSIMPSDYYDEFIFSNSKAIAGGKNTGIKYFGREAVDLSIYPIKEENKSDFIVKDKYYQVLYSRKGDIYFESNKAIYTEKKLQLIMVLSPKVDLRYLEYLRSINVSYIICSTIKESLEKLYKEFGIKVLALTGGAIINGGFLKEDLIDEFSLVIVPYIQGGKKIKPFIETELYSSETFKFSLATPIGDGAVQVVFKKSI